jgi:hypothetical protein
MRRTALVALFVLLGPAARAGYGPGVVLFTFKDAAIVESSGVASSARSADVLFTHNDSGDRARFFAVGRTGQTIATYTLRGINAADWEDMARGPAADGGPALFLADIGDNEPSTRPSMVVHEVQEPQIGVTPAEIVPTASYTLSYEDGSHDAEAFMVDPLTRDFVVVTKDGFAYDGALAADPGHVLGRSGVYVAQPPAPGVRGILRRVATIRLDLLADAAFDPLAKGRHLLVTGGDISPDRSRIVVRTYVQAFEWRLGSRTVADAFAGSPAQVPLPASQQGEAIGYTADGTSLVTTSEGAHAPVHLIAGDDRGTSSVVVGRADTTFVARLNDADTGAPLAGRAVRMRIGTRTFCTKTTGQDGTIACDDVTASLRTAVANGFAADFGGDDAYQGSVGVTTEESW